MPKETESTQTKIALIQSDVENIKKSQDRMELKVDALQGIFWTTKGHDEFVAEVNKRFVILESKNAFWRWLTPALSAFVALIIEYLFINYLEHLH